MEGFVDFTGGFPERHSLKDAPSDLFPIIKKALKAKSLLSCAINVKMKKQVLTSKQHREHVAQNIY